MKLQDEIEGINKTNATLMEDLAAKTDTEEQLRIEKKNLEVEIEQTRKEKDREVEKATQSDLKWSQLKKDMDKVKENMEMMIGEVKNMEDICKQLKGISIKYKGGVEEWNLKK